MLAIKNYKQIRKENLRALIKQFGSQQKLADASNTDKSYFSQILSPKDDKQIGDHFARKLELAAGKPPHWLDIEHPELTIKSQPSTVAIRLKELMDKEGVTAYALANFTGLNQPTITRILNGESKQPKTANLNALAKHFSVSTEWLMFGGGQTHATPNQVHFFQEIPLINAMQAGGWREQQEFDPNEILEWMRSTRPMGTHTFAMRVQGDSMSPMFQDGSIIIIEPAEVPKHGSYVIAKFNIDTEATFKQYVIDAGRVYLRPLNTQYPTLEIKEDCRIIGVVVESVARFV